MGRLLPIQAPKPAWPPFVMAAFVLTLTSGTLTGALDLYSLRVALEPVPVDHSRAHGLSQVFGLFGLFVMGLSLHLAPRFFATTPPSQRFVRILQWLSMTGTVLLVYGRMGQLLPLSGSVGLGGAFGLMCAVLMWAVFVVGLWRRSPLAEKDALHGFLLFGVFWWLWAAVALFLWNWGQVYGGRWWGLPLEAVWAPALFGGTASWLWGIFLRAGMCVLQVRFPSPRALKVFLAVWQVAALAVAMASLLGDSTVEAWSSLLLSIALVGAFWGVRPFSGPNANSMQAVALRTGMVFLLVCAGLHGWLVFSSFGVWAPPLLKDAARHAFTLGGVAVLLFGFAGRMVPSFQGQMLRWPKLYAAGVIALALSSLLRLAQLLPTRMTIGLAGFSGILAFVGMLLLAVCLWPAQFTTLRLGLSKRALNSP